jgi:hypothetical protein
MNQPQSIVHHQRPSCSKQTQAKAARLEVLDITRRLAVVRGDHGEYYVDMLNVICGCKAGRDGLRCSHAMAALIERSRMAGYGDVTFFDDQQAARAACVAHLKAGRKARLSEDNGYIFVECQPTPPPQPQPRWYLDYNRATGQFDVIQAGAVVGTARTYLEVEATNA